MPKFNYGAARAAGHSDEEIAAYLAKQRAAGVDVWLDPSEVSAIRAGGPLQSQGGIDSSAAPEATGVADPYQNAQIRRSIYRMAPAAGGLIGGIGGGLFGGYPGAVAGAGIGGAAGKGIEQIGLREPLGPIGGAGIEQAGLEALGGPLQAGGMALGRKIYGRSFGPLTVLADKFGTTREKIVDVAYGMGAQVTPEGRAAVRATGKGYRAVRAGILGSTGGSVGAEAISNIVIRDAEAALGSKLTGKEKAALISMVQDEADAILASRTHGVVPKAKLGAPAIPASKVLNEYGKPAIAAQPGGPRRPSRYTARELEQIKEVAARNADPRYRARQAETSVAASPELSEQIAGGARRRLAGIPGVGPLTRRIGETKMVSQAIRGSLGRGSEWTPLHIGPFGIGLSRGTSSKIGLGLAGTRTQMLLRQFPRLATALLIQSAEPDATQR